MNRQGQQNIEEIEKGCDLVNQLLINAARGGVAEWRRDRKRRKWE